MDSLSMALLRQFLSLISILSFSVLLGPQIAYGADITAVKQVVVDGQTHVTVAYDGVVKAPNVFLLAEGEPRLVIDVPDAKDRKLAPSPIKANNPIIQIRHAMRGEGTRLVLDLMSGSALIEHSHEGELTTIILSGRTSKGDKAVAIVPARLANVRAAPRISQKSPLGIAIPRVKPSLSSVPARKSVIVIDPGHGGYDPGAIGGAGTQEKAVTLSAAIILQKELLKTGRYEVILTRNSDVYVVHDERVRLARTKDADLFISLHADSLESNVTRGASVYTLADYARKRSTRLVNSQNWIMDVDLSQQSDNVGDILVDLAQRKTFSNSDRFAEMLVPRLSKVTQILGNTHRRAGLAVLLAPDVPAVLLEMGFISNAQDEKALNSSSHQTKVMRAVVSTIDAYFAE